MNLVDRDLKPANVAHRCTTSHDVTRGRTVAGGAASVRVEVDGAVVAATPVHAGELVADVEARLREQLAGGRLPLQIERVFEPSAVRRGRMATSPVFFVNTPGWRWRFPRKRDAQAFVAAGGVCPNHVERFGCPHCIGSRSPLSEAP